MSQTSVADEPSQAYEGKVENFDKNIVTGLAASLIYFGKVVAAQTADVGLPKTVELMATGLVPVGIAIADPSIETIPGNAFGSYAAEEAVPVMRRGRLWVVSADVVDDISKAVFVKVANPGGSPPAESLGSFRATAAGDYVNANTIFTNAAVAWIGGRVIGSQNFGLLEINLP